MRYLKRYFLAIPVSGDVACKIDSKTKDLFNIKGRTKLDKYHITLLFLGNVELAKVLSLLQDFSFNKFVITTNKINYFQFPNKAEKVFYLGVKNNFNLKNLHDKIASLLKPMYNDVKPFRPHITLFYSKDDFNIQFVENSFEVNKIILYNSNLETNKYEVIKEFIAK